MTGPVGGPGVSVLGVQPRPAGQEEIDLAHIDLWAAGNAPTLVWQPIYDWLRKH